jgi:hypothetical protein
MDLERGIADASNLVVLLTASSVFGLAAAALARGDGWERLPAETFVLPAQVCGFPVQVDFLVNEEYAKTVSQDDQTTVLPDHGPARAASDQPLHRNIDRRTRTNSVSPVSLSSTDTSTRYSIPRRTTSAHSRCMGTCRTPARSSPDDTRSSIRKESRA